LEETALEEAELSEKPGDRSGFSLSGDTEEAVRRIVARDPSDNAFEHHIVKQGLMKGALAGSAFSAMIMAPVAMLLAYDHKASKTSDSRRNTPILAEGAASSILKITALAVVAVTAVSTAIGGLIARISRRGKVGSDILDAQQFEACRQQLTEAPNDAEHSVSTHHVQRFNERQQENHLSFERNG
jgi:hypothetical protein